MARRSSIRHIIASTRSQCSVPSPIGNRLGQLNIEPLESRCMLSATSSEVRIEEVDQSTQLDTQQEQAVRTYLVQDPATAYLQQGESDLRLIEIEQEADGTTTRFQQTHAGLPIHNAIITVLQGQDGSFQEVFDHGYPSLNPSTLVGEGIDQPRAELLAEKSLAEQPLESHSESVLFPSGTRAHLAWQVTTFVEGGSADSSLGNYITIVDASSGQLLSQESQTENFYGQFESDTGVYPRIVINNTIGPAGSRAYAAPFDAVAALALGCTGTLIAPDVVISARHCGASGGSQIIFGDDSNNGVYTATVSSSILPDGGGSLLDGGDVSILVLTADVPSNVATPMRLIEETDSLEGQAAATLGYGWNGVGSQGHQGNGDDIRWGGENIIDVYGSPAGASGSNILSTDFDNGTVAANTIGGSDPNPLEFEATTAPGDSGGPLLVQVEGGEWVIAGVLSGGTTATSVYGDISWWTGVAPFRSQIEAAGGVFLGGGLGTVEFDKGTYVVEDTINVTVRDPNAITPLEVTLVSDSGDSETITLTNSGGITYTGSIASSGDAVATSDGELQVTLFDDIQVTYNDPDNGDGVPIVATDTASIGNVRHFPSTDIPVSIVDNQTRTSQLEITDAATILDLDVQLNITHTYDADLEVFLIGPDGTRVELFRDVGGSGNNFNDTILDDEATTGINSGGAPFVGSYSPSGNLGQFDGLSMAGTWTLEITDDAGLDQGTLNSWCLYIDSMSTAAGPGDFDGDGTFDCLDINVLVDEIADGTHDDSFDLTDDGLVNLADRDAWLATAGEANLGAGQSYQLGDANLDGMVNGQDFAIWNANKFSSVAAWCAADFNADGFVDGFDFFVWNANKETNLTLSSGPSATPLNHVGEIATGRSTDTVFVPQKTLDVTPAVAQPARLLHSPAVAQRSAVYESSIARDDVTETERASVDFIFESLGRTR